MIVFIYCQEPTVVFMKDSFGSRLKFFRSLAGLTQQQLADASGVSRKIISDYEVEVKPDALPRPSTLFKISQALGMEGAELMPKPNFENEESLIKEFLNPSIYLDLSLMSKEAIQVLESISIQESLPVAKIIENLIVEKYPKHIEFVKNTGSCEPDDATLSMLEYEKLYFNYMKNQNKSNS